ncbi:hypothetical protein J5J86_20665 [Aquabacter sp. L1I39]|uniref:hypothetical protein n=1 Tax=Aquabacter sp. L1I39 TaxID=2820278 RepID=UPI001AD9D39F|nr:hypothetical protein [Aquabacter sp. L1I39]QTL03140.1 hypothetical protein J5J86_20665 [Aquabacter sp. L1I39]
MASGVKEIFDGLRQVLDQRKGARKGLTAVDRVALALETLADEATVIRTELSLIRMISAEQARGAPPKKKETETVIATAE